MLYIVEDRQRRAGDRTAEIRCYSCSPRVGGGEVLGFDGVAREIVVSFYDHRRGRLCQKRAVELDFDHGDDRWIEEMILMTYNLPRARYIYNSKVAWNAFMLAA